MLRMYDKKQQKKKHEGIIKKLNVRKYIRNKRYIVIHNYEKEWAILLLTDLRICKKCCTFAA